MDALGQEPLGPRLVAHMLSYTLGCGARPILAQDMDALGQKPLGPRLVAQALLLARV